MGIRFACHSCGKSLNIKSDLAGRRGICPECRTRFRIPVEDAEFSTPVEQTFAASSASVNSALSGADSKLSGASSSLNAAATSGASVASNFGSDQSSATGLLERGIDSSAEESSLPNETPREAPTGNPASRSAVASDLPIPTEHLTEVPADAYDLIDSDPEASWYVRPQKGGQFGPADGEMLKMWIGEKRVAKNSLLWREGWPQWREAVEVLPKLTALLPGETSDSSSVQFGDNRRTSFDQTPAAATPSGDAPSRPLLQIETDPNSSKVGESDSRSSLIGASTLGRTRQKRTARRITLVAVLATLVIGLVATLVIVATSRG